jgi:hypothetical protein
MTSSLRQSIIRFSRYKRISRHGIKISKIRQNLGVRPREPNFLLDVGSTKGYKSTKFGDRMCPRLGARIFQSFDFGPMYLGNHVIDLVQVLTKYV